MRKHFLLLLWLTLLPLAGWAQTAQWNGGSAPDLTYGDAKPNFPTLIAVTSGYGSHNVTTLGEGTTTPTGSVNQYRWKLSKDGSDINYSSVSTLDAGDYTLTLYIRHQTGQQAYYPYTATYGDATRTLSFTVKKADVVLALYQVVREWRAPWEDPDIATLESTAYKLTGADATWDKISPALTWNQLQLVEHVGSYEYTIDVDADNDAVKNYNIYIDGGAADLKVEQNTTGKLSDATGKGLTYLATEQALVPTADITFLDAQNNVAGDIEYKLSTASDWSSEIPTATDAGIYTVEYRGVGNQDHTDAVAKSYSVTIAKATITNIADWATYFTPAAAVADELIYNGSAQALITPAVILDNEVFADATVEYHVGTGSWGTAAANYSATNAQNETAYNVYYRIRDAKNFNDFTSAAIEKVIKRVDPTVTLPTPRDVTYNPGTTYRLFNYPDASVGTDFGTLQFRGGTYSTGWTSFNNIAATNAGKYTVEWRVQQTANVNAASGTIECEIKKADPALNATPGALATRVFNGSDQSLLETNYTVTGGTIQYYVDGEPKGAAANVQAKNVGKYKIAYKITGNSNYNDYPADADADPVEIGEAEITKATLNFGVDNLEVDWADGKTYEWANIVDQLVTSDDWLAGETDAQKADIMFAALNITVNGGAADDTNEDFVAMLAGDAGTYDIALTANDDAEGVNYKIKLYNSTAKVIINKVDATPAVLADAGKTYNGENQDLVTITTDAVGADKVMYIVGGDTAPEADSEAWAEGIPQETDANTYNVWQKVVGDKNHNDVVAAAAVVGTIVPKPIADADFTIAPASSAYTGDNQNETVITVVPGDDEPMVVDKDIKSITLPADVTSFGEYDVTIEGQGNYTGTITKKFNITQAENNATVTIAGWTYGEYDEEVNAPQTTADFGVETVKYTYSVKDANDWKDEVPTEFGTYTVKAYIAETADYAEAVAYADFDIAKADVTDIVKPASINETYDLTYNGADQPLVKAATFEDGIEKGTFKYFVGETAPAADSEDWSEDIPVAKDAGEYIVKTLFTPDDNHNPATVEDVTVTIHKAEISYVLGNVTKEWDGAPLDEDQINSLFAINNGELFGVDKYEVPFYFILPEEYKDANEEGYTFTQVDYKFKTIEDGYDKDYPENYDVKFTGTAKIVITKKNITTADFKAPEAIPGLEYNGQVQTLVTTGEVTTTYLWDGDEEAKPIGTIKFASTEGGEFKAFEDAADVVKGTDKGGYTVYYMVEGDKNHNDFVATEATLIADVEIATKALADDMFTLSDDVIYNGAAQYPTITAKDEITVDEVVKNILTDNDYTIEIKDGEGNVVAADKLINADTYTFTFTATDEGNYTGSVEQEFTISPIEIIAEAVSTSKVYNGLAGLELREGEKYANDATEIEVKFGGLLPDDGDAITVGEGAITINDAKKDVGSYDIVIDPAKFESTNYTVIAATEAKFTITAAPLTISWNDEYELAEGEFTKVYGAAETPLTATADNLKIEGAGEGDDIIGNVVITRAEGDAVGSYAIELSAKEGATVFSNYAPITFNGAEDIFTITPASIKVSIKALEVTYTGEPAVAPEFTAEDLVITGLQNGDSNADVFSTLPTATIAENDGTIGDYQVTLSGGVSDNYIIGEKDYLPSFVTVVPFDLSEAEVTIATQQAAVGDEAEDIEKVATFTISGLAKDADAAGFKVAVANDFVDADGKIKLGADYTKGLVLVANDEGEDGNEIAYNYTGWENAFFGKLIVEGGETLVLDDTEEIKISEATGEGEAVTVSFSDRTINTDSWNVLVLPFDVTPAQVSDAFGYAVVDILNPNGSDADDNAHFSITTSGTIAAGTPFIFKPGKPVEGAQADNFSKVTFVGVQVKEYDDYIKNAVQTDAKSNKFVGIFEETKITGENFWYMSGGKWYDCSDYTATLKPLRAYVELATAGARIMIEEADGTVTAIDAISFSKAAKEGVYTLNGVKVNNANRKGVFIQNGKKVINK